MALITDDLWKRYDDEEMKVAGYFFSGILVSGRLFWLSWAPTQPAPSQRPAAGRLVPFAYDRESICAMTAPSPRTADPNMPTQPPQGVGTSVID